MKIEKLPSAEKMKAEYDTFADEKEKLYSEYKSARQEAKEYSVIKQNVDSLLSSPKKRAGEIYGYFIGRHILTFTRYKNPLIMSNNTS